jgi:hypothetical protein
MRVDYELLAFGLTDSQFSEFLKYNNTEVLKCCWKDTGSANYGIQGTNVMATSSFGATADLR